MSSRLARATTCLGWLIAAPIMAASPQAGSSGSPPGWQQPSGATSFAAGTRRSTNQQVAAAIVGMITAARTLEPLAAASIQLEGTRLGATSGATGAYRIANVPAGTYTLIARRLGYARATQQVTIRDSATVTVNFSLDKTAATLDQIIVTGTPQEQTKREIGNAVGRVNASEIAQLAPPPNVQQLLNVVPGVRVQSAGGDVGSGGNTRIRGANSMTLASEPLLYIDGVRVNNAAADNGAFPGVGVDSR